MRPTRAPRIRAAATLLAPLLLLPACRDGEDDDLLRLPDLAERLAPGEVRAGVVAKDEDLIGGPKAEGRIGDLKLYNAHAAFIVEGVRRAGGYRFHGGNLVDADVIRPEGEPGDDRYGETFFAWDLQVFEPTLAEVISDGRDGVAHVRLTGRTAPFAWADSFVREVINPPRSDLEIVFDYRLGPGDTHLHLQITLTNPGDEMVELQYPMILASHGDGAHLYAPPGGLTGLSGTGPIPYLAAVGRDLSYALLAAEDDLAVLIDYAEVALVVTPPVSLFPGESFPFDYYLVVTDQSAAGIEAAHRALVTRNPAGRIAGQADLPATVAEGGAWVAARRGGAVAALAPVDASGGFDLELPPGDYQIEVHAHHHAAASPVPVAVTEDATVPVAASVPEAARVTSTVTDTDGNAIGARVTFFRLGETPSPFAPDAVRHGEAWHAGVSGVAYVVDGPETTVLPAGQYRAVASRGPTWEIHERTFDVAAGASVDLDFSLDASVDTQGFVSADFHLHALLSPDSSVPYDVRVRQAVTEALDLPVLTEHVWAGGLQDEAEHLGFDDVVVGVAGQEVTTFAYGHFNVFPLVVDPDAPSAGAIFEHGRTPAELFADMRNQHPGEELIQINHPRGVNAGSYFSWVGLDADADTVQRAEGWTLDWELIEVFNGSCSTGGRNGETLADWIGMTNHGHRKTLSSGSDSHTERKIPGTPRNWIALDKAEVLGDHQNLVPAVRDRALFISCGPFVRFEAEDGTGLGGLTTVDGEGRITFRARVEAPTWMRVDTLRLLENGVAIETVDLQDRNGEVVRFDGELVTEPSADAWYALEVLGSGSLVPISWNGSPYALTNPIEVDADGDGVWTPPGRP